MSFTLGKNETLQGQTVGPGSKHHRQMRTFSQEFENSFSISRLLELV